MDLPGYKKLIGKKCVVIDPRSKKKEFQAGTIVSVKIKINNINGEIKATASYDVKLHKLTRSRAKWKMNPLYHRIVTVGGNNINI